MIYGLDPLYWALMLPVIILSFWAQFSVKNNFKKFSKIRNSRSMTGSQAAEFILQKQGIMHVKVERTSGWLSDHYSPKEQVLRLSKGVYDSPSIAAVAIAAHEAGHAIQYHQNMGIVRLRQALAKPATFASNGAMWIIVIGMLLGALSLAKVGVFLFMGLVLFQLVTLPVELDASKKAKKILQEYAMVNPQESQSVSKVLNSAAMTYVAAALSSLTTLLYFALRLGLLGGRRR